jgi:hypothetical protein
MKLPRRAAIARLGWLQYHREQGLVVSGPEPTARLQSTAATTWAAGTSSLP